MIPSWIGIPLLLPYRINVGSLGSILPYSMNGPFKKTLMALFRLAWSTKLQLPILITVCFMAFDIHLQLEINIFWEANHQNGRNRHGNANPVVPRLEINTNEPDEHSADDSDDETDSDETELHSLKDNLNSDDSDDEDDDERPSSRSRYYSETEHNFSDRSSGGNNDDSDSGNGSPPIVVEVQIHRTEISILSSEEAHQLYSRGIEDYFRDLCQHAYENSITDNSETVFYYGIHERVHPVPSPFNSKLVVCNFIQNAQSSLERVDYFPSPSNAKKFSLFDSSSNFIRSVIRNEN